MVLHHRGPKREGGGREREGGKRERGESDRTEGETEEASCDNFTLTVPEGTFIFFTVFFFIVASYT